MVKKVSPSSRNNNRKNPPGTNNFFLEAFQNLGGEVIDSAIHDVIEGIPRTAFDQLTGRQGELKPNQTLSLNKLTREERGKEGKKESLRFQQEFLNLRRQEKLIRPRQEETQLQIKAILGFIEQVFGAI